MATTRSQIFCAPRHLCNQYSQSKQTNSKPLHDNQARGYAVLLDWANLSSDLMLQVFFLSCFFMFLIFSSSLLFCLFCFFLSFFIALLLDWANLSYDHLTSCCRFFSVLFFFFFLLHFLLYNAPIQTFKLWKSGTNFCRGSERLWMILT